MYGTVKRNCTFFLNRPNWGMPKQSGKMNQREREICSRLKQFREHIKWPQAAFAYEIGTTKDQIASIEYGRTPLRYDVGYRACLIFDINPEWLATNKGPVTPNLMHNPTSGNLPKKILFSEVYDAFVGKEGYSSVGIKTKSGAEKELRREPSPGVPSLDDPTGYFVNKLLEILQREKFDGPIAREKYIFDVIRMAQSIAMDHRRRRIKGQVRCSAGADIFDGTQPDLSAMIPTDARKILALRKKIKDLEIKVMMLEGDDDYPPRTEGEKIIEQKTCKATLDTVTEPVNLTDMNQQSSLWDNLRERLVRLTQPYGSKADLARQLGVTRQAAAEWLSGASSPTAETTLHLLKWVNESERKTNAPGSVEATTKGKTQKGESNETHKSSRRKS